MYQPRKILKGQIHYVNKTGGSFVGSEQMAGRPAIIVSNNTGNHYSNVVEVVYLTTQCKADMPTHVPILSAKKPSIALCEEIVSVDKRRLGKYIGSITSEEMQQVNQAMMVSLGILPGNLIHMISEMMTVYVEDREQKQVSDMDWEAYIRTQAERDVYKKLYSDLLYTHFHAEKINART
nr:type II toxin-antitoxin system PemK/MazF family toxin [uncultured Blautia sp.]